MIDNSKTSGKTVNIDKDIIDKKVIETKEDNIKTNIDVDNVDSDDNVDNVDSDDDSDDDNIDSDDDDNVDNVDSDDDSDDNVDDVDSDDDSDDDNIDSDDDDNFDNVDSDDNVDNVDSDDDSDDDNVDSDDSDKTPFETEIKDKINNKINWINWIYIKLAKAKTEITNKIKLVPKEIGELEDNSRLRLVKLNKIDAILDDGINVVRFEIYGKKKGLKND